METGSKVGSRVLIQRGHPWRGHSGEITATEQVDGATAVRVLLDNGCECFAFPGDWRPIR